MYVLRQYTLPLLFALALHVAVVWSLYQNFDHQQSLKTFAKPPPAVMADLIVLQPKAKLPPPKPAPQAAVPKVDPAEAARKQAELEAQRKAQKDKEEAQRLALEKAAKEKAEQEAAEQARKAQEQADRLKRLSELANSSFDQAIAEESADLAAGDEDLVAQSYRQSIYQQILSNWSRPPSARNGMKATLVMELIPTGDVVSVTITESSGNAAFDRSAEQAVRRAGRFEVPADNAIFERHFRKVYLLFQPEDLLR